MLFLPVNPDMRFKASNILVYILQKHVAAGTALLLLFFLSFQSSAQRAYFQQRVDYDIAVSLNDSSNMLNGKITMQYRNNSQDTLTFIWMHLWPNAYANGNTALSTQLLESGNTSLYFARKDDLGFIDQLAFTADGQPLDLDYDVNHKDMAKVRLRNPILPGASTEIATPFRVKIPSGKISRMGFIGQSYQLSQWYPKPAVYDREGWHPMTYLDQGEFYSEFGSFKVAITLPENYVVAATGRLQETSERNWLLEKAATTSRLMDFDTTLVYPPSADKLKTITFVQDSIHDFAWFADKRFHVLKNDFTLDNGHKIEAWAFFTNKEAFLWKQSVQYIEQGIRYYSSRIGPYPYDHFTAVDGTIAAGAGMEYPMITVIGFSGDAFALEDVIVHEMGHSWFYGMLASNERKYGWMDEGINSYYELQYVDYRYSGDSAAGKNDVKAGFTVSTLAGSTKITMLEGFRFAYDLSAFDNSDQPVTTPTEEFTYLNYGAVMYTRTALAFEYLEDYLGTSVFDSIMKTYFNTWKFRHPGPGDLREIFTSISQKNLDWFFDGLLNTIEPVNYKIVKAKNTNGNLTLNIRNNGTNAAPFKTVVDSTRFQWHEGFTGRREITISGSMKDQVSLNPGYLEMLKASGSLYRNRTFFPKANRYKIRMFPEIKSSDNTSTLVLLPMVAWNRYNEIMGGAVISNFSLLPSKFEFTVVPLYDFKNNALAGTGSAIYHVRPLQGWFKEINLALNVKQFAYDHIIYSGNGQNADKEVLQYMRLVPELELKFRPENIRSEFQHQISYRNVSLWRDELTYNFDVTDSTYKAAKIETYRNFNQLIYKFRNIRILDPFAGMVLLEQGENYSKLSGEFNYRFSYRKFKKGVDIRFFAGGFLDNGRANTLNNNFRMSGWEGRHDYLYEEYYFGRSDERGFWKQQFYIRDGGFKTPTFVGQSNKWVAALNVDVDLPFPVPISLFGSLGTYEGITTIFSDLDNAMMYEGGVAVKLIRNVVEIYVPLFYSDDIDKTFELNRIDFIEQIRFVLNISKITPYAIRNRYLETFR